MRPVAAHNSVLAVNLVDYLVTGDKTLGGVNVKGDTFRPFEKIEKLEAERQAKLNEKNKEIDEEIQAANQGLEDELAKINQDMQLKQRSAQVQLRAKSQEIQKQLEPFLKFMRPDGSISLDKDKDKDTISKLMSLQNDMQAIRQQVQQDTRVAMMELQKQIQITGRGQFKIEELEKKKRKDRREGREDIESVERIVQIANLFIMPIILAVLGTLFFQS